MGRRVWLLASSLALSCGSYATEPIDTRIHRPSSLLFLRMPDRSFLQEANSRWDLSVTIANDTKLPSFDIREDHETWVFRGTWIQGLGPSSEWSVTLPVVSRGTGILDSWIASWHDIIEQPQLYADRRPLGAMALRYPGSADQGSATGLGDVSVGYGLRLGNGFGVRAGVKVPTGNTAALLGSGNWDAGAQLSYETPSDGPWGFYASASLVAQGPAVNLDHVRGLVHQGTITVGYAANASEEYLLQWNSEASAMVAGVGPSDATHRVLTWAYRKRTETGVWEVFLSEDGDFRWTDFPGGPAVGPDLTLGLRWIGD